VRTPPLITSWLPFFTGKAPPQPPDFSYLVSAVFLAASPALTRRFHDVVYAPYFCTKKFVGNDQPRYGCGRPLGGVGCESRPKLAWTPTACPLPHSLLTATPRQRDIARQRCQPYRASPLSHPLPTATLAHCHIACPLPHSSPTVTQLASDI
jgi:hypothetical protein